jgi:hypothetical protein
MSCDICAYEIEGDANTMTLTGHHGEILRTVPICDECLHHVLLGDGPTVLESGTPVDVARQCLQDLDRLLPLGRYVEIRLILGNNPAGPFG